MKESIGSVASLYIIMFFIVIMFGFILTILSYYKSFKINNIITSTIEDSGSFNSSSIEEIAIKLKNYGYDTTRDVDCPQSEGFIGSANDGDSSLQYSGYCVYIKDDTPAESKSTLGDYAYYHYEIITYMNLSIMNYQVIKIPIKTKTSTMYSCYNMEDCMSSGGI